MMEETNMEQRSRRWALKAGALGFGAAAAGLLSSCAAQVPKGASESMAASSPVSTTSTPATNAPSSVASPAQQYPTRAQIIEQFKNAPAGEFGLEAKGIELAMPTGKNRVALTFDACGGAHGSAIDHALIDALREREMPATLFVNQRWARSNGRYLAQLVDDPLFEIANHGTSHVPLTIDGQAAYGISGTRSVGEAYDEVMGNQRYLNDEFGVAARFFRSGTAHMDEVSAALCRQLGLIPMNFTVNLDAGATFPAATVAAQFQLLKDGGVGIGHFNQPASGTARGIARGLAGALQDGLEFVKLSEAW